MERGGFIDEESGEWFDVEIEPYHILSATFGISFEEAKELIKKYGVDIDKLNALTDEEMKARRKLQIIVCANVQLVKIIYER